MATFKQNDEVRYVDPTGRELVGIVNIVEDVHGDAHVRIHGEGMVVIPASECTLVTCHGVED